MAVEPAHHDENWLKNALQSALELELATLPPYLCALWSIIDANEAAYKIVRSIVLEEMLHFALVCNMLTALDGSPVINDNSNTPRYPGKLPGNVKPALTVYLAGFSKEYLEQVCIPIEAPEFHPIANLASSDTQAKSYTSIGAFYDAILSAFQSLGPSYNFNLDRQLGGHTLNRFPLFKINSLIDVENAIKEINQQGEGTQQTPDGPDAPESNSEVELAHYYKFKELLLGKSLVFIDNKWTFSGPEISFPRAQPMSPVPSGGYPTPSAEVQDLLDIFNDHYTTMLNLLQSAWQSGSQDSLSKAIGVMFTLKKVAVKLMAIPLPDGSGNYGPDFLLLRVR